MATHSSILAWRNPWTEEPCGLQSIRLHRAGCTWACTHAHQRPSKARACFSCFKAGEVEVHPNECMVTWLVGI